MLVAPGLLLVVAQDLLDAGGLHLVNMGINLLDRAELLQQLGGGLLANARNLGDVVGGVASQSLVVGNQRRGEAVALLSGRHVVDLCVAEADAPRGDHVDGWLHQLQGVGVACHDQSHHSLLHRLVCQRADYVVGLEAWQPIDGDVQGVDDILDAAELGSEVVGHRRAGRFVVGEIVVAEGAAHIEGHRHILRLLLAQHLQQHRGEAEHCVHALTARGHQRGWHRVVGAIDERVSVYQHQPGHL